jgi:hypothetical protein
MVYSYVPIGKPLNKKLFTFVLEKTGLAGVVLFMVMITPVLLITGTAGEISKNILPLDNVQVAGLGVGVITTVAHVPVPEPQLGSVLSVIVMLKLEADVQPPKS